MSIKVNGPAVFHDWINWRYSAPCSSYFGSRALAFRFGAQKIGGEFASRLLGARLTTLFDDVPF